MLLAPAFILIWPALYAWVGPWTGPVLVGVILIAWVQDGFSVKALGVFLGSGLLGATVFGLPLQDPLFPLLSGLFCVPALLVSGDWREAVFTTAPSWKLSHAFLATVLSGFSVLLPALSPAFIGALAYFFIPHNDPKIALVVGFAIASSKMVFD
ncbi:MAG TPA: hypothetical protein VI874_03180, partial [Candidatus Norongarragalinales archaeon]|nr:hypothetical protein [Candidatus Norongarragalinales archaeon]